MANTRFDADKASKIILDASLMGDQQACDKHDISLRTLQRYRLRLESDPEFVANVAEKKALQDKEWASEMPSAIAACVDFLKRAAQNCDETNPDAVHAVAGALKIMSEVSITRDVIDARLRGEDVAAD